MNMRISILGLYNYDDSIFDDMFLPSDTFTQDFDDLFVSPLAIDKDDLIFSLCSELSSFGLIYPDGDYMKRAIKAWSRKHLWSWQKIYESFFYKYNPIWNKDGKITRTETEAKTGQETTTGNETSSDTSSKERTANNTRTESLTNSSSSTSTRSVAAYNTNVFTNAERMVTEESGSANGTITDSGTETESGSGSSQKTLTGNKSGSENITRTYEDFERGNIGVTMTQAMIEADRALYTQNIYDKIIEEFKKEFCLMIY